MRNWEPSTLDPIAILRRKRDDASITKEGATILLNAMRHLAFAEIEQHIFRVGAAI